MSLCRLSSYTLEGLELHPVQIDVDVSKGMPHFAVVGMAGACVKEAKERVRSAIVQSGFRFPITRKVVNLAPAERAKRGSHFDLAMAIGLLVASEQLSSVSQEVLILGELGLEGDVRPVSGVLPAVSYAKRAGFESVLLPRENLQEASLIEGLRLIPVDSLRQVVAHFLGQELPEERLPITSRVEKGMVDFKTIAGQEEAKRALLIAASGGHHVLMKGPPGSGKSLLSQAFASILPAMSEEEALEVQHIYSAMGLDQHWGQRPFRSVHSRATPHQVLGGGALLRAGEITLAHRGVLFLDELPEFKRETLESLRGPIEHGYLQVRHGKRQSRFPCRFQLVAAMNPCPCGHFGQEDLPCACGPTAVFRYQSKLSGPLLDRIDLHLELQRVPFDELNHVGESSATLRQKVESARERQAWHWEKYGFSCNQELPSSLVHNLMLKLDEQLLLERASQRYGLSLRALHKILRVALTIAHLEGCDQIERRHLMESLRYRMTLANLS